MKNPRLTLITAERPLIAITGRFLIPRRRLRQALKVCGFKVISTPRWGSVLIVGKDAGSAVLAAKAKSVPSYTLAGFIVALLLGRVTA
jgi:hypothetical protein